MSSQRTLSVVELGLAVAVGASLWFGYSYCQTGQQQFLNRTEELAESVANSDRIRQLQELPDQATLASHSTRAIAQAIEQSAATATIDSGQIASIEPQVPAREGDTAYLRHATVVKLDDVSLTQLANLTKSLRSATASIGQLHITALRLDAPYQKSAVNGNKEYWSVEFTLTYYVYSPKSPASKRS